jgi:hypothetical protein
MRAGVEHSKCDSDLEEQLEQNMSLRRELGAEVARALSSGSDRKAIDDGLDELRQQLKLRLEALNRDR